MHPAPRTFHLLSDRELVALIVNGNQQAAVYLLREHCKEAFNYIAYRVYGGAVERDELMNELYIYLQENDWERLRNFQYKSKITTWIVKVGLRLFSKKMELMIDTKENLPLIEDISKAIQVFDKAHTNFINNMDLYHAINELKNPRFKYVLIALDLEDRKPEVVAKELNIEVANLYNIRKRAFDKLKENVFKTEKS